MAEKSTAANPDQAELRGWLETALPPVNIDLDSGIYGCKRLLADYCGFKHIPWQGYFLSGGSNWQHGWHPPEHNIHPEVVVGTDCKSYLLKDKARFFVAREDQREYLSSHGYTDVQVIGMPFVYTKLESTRRIPGSLLIMPTHSGDLLEPVENCEEYVEAIRSIAHRFSHVAVCVHGNCRKQGRWVPHFESIGIPVFDGAERRDANALRRVRFLMDTFEFVTTNGFGSHLAYASYSGAKVSIWGPPEWKDVNAIRSSQRWKDFPPPYRLVLEQMTNDTLSGFFPELFSEPQEARIAKDWSRWQLGVSNIPTPWVLKRLIGWDLKTRLIQSFKVLSARRNASKN